MNLVAVLAAFGAMPYRTLAQTCQPYWLKPDPFHPFTFGGQAQVVFDDGHGPAMYATAFDPNVSPLVAVRIARWNGLAWQALDQGVLPLAGVDSIRVLDDGLGPRMYATVTYYPTAAQRVDTTLVWDGAAWQATPPGFTVIDGAHFIFPLCSFDDGTGAAIYGQYNDSIAKWDGVRWNSIGMVQGWSDVNLRVFDLGGGPALYAYGQFSAIIGVPNTSGIAKWDGHQWSAMGSGVIFYPSTFMDVALFDTGAGPELYICGMQSAGGLPDNTIAKWNGLRWLPVPFDQGSDISRMIVFDDGSGSALMASGPFGSVEGQPCHGFAKFDGQHWHPALGSVASGNGAGGMCVFEQDPRGPSLFVTNGGGVFGLGQLVSCAGGRSCYVNCDNSSVPPVLNINDFMCFVNRFAARTAQGKRDPYADCNQDGQYNILDFMCFINRFATGCPGR